MWIYKITNTVNGKVYIGQTINSINKRFHRHLNDAMNHILDTHFARAIRKYGPDKFIVEEIDTAKTQDELNLKEQSWIRYYDSVKTGYNETDAICKSGGNTYQSKNEEEMKSIKEKIRQTKLGKNNPMAKRVKRINIFTGEVDIFDTVIACAKACGIKNGKTSVSTRLNGQVTSPYKEWIFEYCDE